MELYKAPIEKSTSSSSSSNATPSSPQPDQNDWPWFKIVAVGALVILFLILASGVFFHFGSKRNSTTNRPPPPPPNITIDFNQSNKSATTKYLHYQVIPDLLPYSWRVVATISKLFEYKVKDLLTFNMQHTKVPSPDKFGFRCSRHFALDYLEDGLNMVVQLGVWHIAPQMEHQCRDLNERSEDHQLVVLIAHGRGAYRHNANRLLVYQLLAVQLNYHVIAYDYRGTADSSPAELSVDAFVNDTIAMYNWIRRRGVPRQRILFWGHSLGTSVMVNTLAKLSNNSMSPPLATVLESPFTTLYDATLANAYMQKAAEDPKFQQYMAHMISDPRINFASIDKLPSVHCPLLIIHAKDDLIIPYAQGERMYQAAKRAQPTKVARYTSSHYTDIGGHAWIALAPELESVVRRFISSILSK